MMRVRAHWWMYRNARDALQLFENHEKSTIEAILLKGLASHHENDIVGALLRIPKHSLLLYMHAYQALIWNKVVSRRIEQFGDKVLVGDLVELPEGVDGNLLSESNGEFSTGIWSIKRLWDAYPTMKGTSRPEERRPPSGCMDPCLVLRVANSKQNRPYKTLQVSHQEKNIPPTDLRALILPESTRPEHEPDEYPFARSHTCGEGDCCQPAHICWEQPNINNGRKRCRKFATYYERSSSSPYRHTSPGPWDGKVPTGAQLNSWFEAHWGQGTTKKRQKANGNGHEDKGSGGPFLGCPHQPTCIKYSNVRS